MPRNRFLCWLVLSLALSGGTARADDGDDDYQICDEVYAVKVTSNQGAAFSSLLDLCDHKLSIGLLEDHGFESPPVHSNAKTAS
jgi:hypothetical protein